MIEHTTHAFDADLAQLKRKIAEMGGRAGNQVSAAVEALLKRDTELARRVIAADDEIDSLQHEIEEKAVITIARRQPMAVDLREIIGALRISNDLERIGDLAENIAKRVPLSADGLGIEDVMLQLKRMAELVTSQLTAVLLSYERRDLPAAIAVWRRDEEVDALNNSMFRELLTHMMENPRNITPCTQLLFCARNLERAGDHITNIAETIHYVVEGRPLPGMRPKADITSGEKLP